jgi:hypothetical protein
MTLLYDTSTYGFAISRLNFRSSKDVSGNMCCWEFGVTLVEQNFSKRHRHHHHFQHHHHGHLFVVEFSCSDGVIHLKDLVLVNSPNPSQQSSISFFLTPSLLENELILLLLILKMAEGIYQRNIITSQVDLARLCLFILELFGVVTSWGTE